MASLDMKLVFSFRRDSLQYIDKENHTDYNLENIEYLGWSLEIDAPTNHKEKLNVIENALNTKFEPMTVTTSVLVYKAILTATSSAKQNQ
ncbi:hypothetical protein HYV31_02915 [candidate division WWE3 bacterium]|nr:hypothetical protein [candidate division WWE3 bacterium]